MPAEDTVFNVLYDKFMFWGILVGIFTFGWMFLAMLRYRDGVEPDTSGIDHIEVGSFPVDRHNTGLEVLFYVLPSIIVVWITMLALASNTAVWVIPAEEDAFSVDIVGKQWFWEFEYQDSLTWEDDPRTTYVDVEWNGSMLTVHAQDSTATNVTVEVDGVKSEYSIDATTGMLTISNMYFDRALHAEITVFDSEETLLHTWEHIPAAQYDAQGNVVEIYTLSTAGGEHLIIPCDEAIRLDMFSRPHDNSNPAYVGVQHSFWLPEWGVKEDLVPGLESGTVMTFQPDDLGTFPIRCAEYCGLDHSKMIGHIDIVARNGENCDADTGVLKIDDTSSSGGGY
tara:strand:- start:11362 stop:12378 length:1017 start_codon:yes stop_codon:yes gene_type:complete